MNTLQKVRTRAEVWTMPRRASPSLYVSDVLAWADAYREREGRCPVARTSRRVPGMWLTWVAVDLALRRGSHGLPGGTTLARLLVDHRGHRHHFEPPRLTSAKVLKWADAHRRRTGSWPTRRSGAIPECPGDTWSSVCAALDRATRGIAKKTSLARLLARFRGKRQPPPLTAEQILRWAEAWRVLYGRWPSSGSGPVGSTGETWLRVDAALRNGDRGLPGGSSLARLCRAGLDVAR